MREIDDDGEWEVSIGVNGVKSRYLVTQSAAYISKNAAEAAAHPVPPKIDRIKQLTDALKAKGIDVGSI